MAKASEAEERAWEAIRALTRRQEQTDREIAQVSKQLGGLGNGMGSIAEGLVAPNLRRLLRQVNIHWSGTRPNAEAEHNGKPMEIDLLAVGQRRGGGPVVVAVEVATRLVQAELERALDKFDRFFDFFPEYRTYDLVGGLAGMKIERETAKHAEAGGLLVIGPSGETARLLNGPRFRPKVWRAGRDGR